jgi:hypothetical protein
MTVASPSRGFVTGISQMSYYYRGLPAWAHGYVPDPRRGSVAPKTT